MKSSLCPFCSLKMYFIGALPSPSARMRVGWAEKGEALGKRCCPGESVSALPCRSRRRRLAALLFCRRGAIRALVFIQFLRGLG